MRKLTVSSIAGLMLALFMPLHASADGMKHGGMQHDQMKPEVAIQASNVWSRATAPSARAGAVFLELTNHGEAPDMLFAAQSDIAERVELHTHTMVDGVMRMRPVEAFEVAPGAPTILQPGGHHIMLMGLSRQLKPGDKFPLTLTFRDAGKVDVEATVGPAGGMSHDGGHGHSGHGHSGHGS